jgi:5-methylcytosine-specific restriction endonuclease McrA
MRDGKRDYKREVAQYTSKPAVKKKRAEQNAARRLMEKAGKVHKGDGKAVDHRVPLSKGGSTAKSNLRVVPERQNDSFSRNSDSSVKRNDGASRKRR